MKNLASHVTLILRKWENVSLFVIAVALCMSVCSSNALAQSGAGSIQGTVTDSTGALIAGASIHVVQQSTNVATETRSNGVGFYQVPGLFTGTYTVTVTAPGMNTYVRTIELLVDQNAVIDARLAPGSVTQQVEVSANLVQLTNTTNGAIGSTLENTRINQLPMNGRDLITLTNEITPGLDSCQQSPSCANGMMPAATTYVVDGVTLASRQYGGSAQVTGSAVWGYVALPDPDAIQEVTIETSGVGAQYSTPAMGVMTSKSGTNQIHGSLFETARNNYWGIAKQRQDPAIYAAPEYIRNEFGASAGGPIVLPHIYHGKDKSFWFFAYERYSQASISYAPGNVPTMAMRSGDFSGLLSGAGVLQQLYDPATTTSSSNCNGTGVANQWCRAPFPTSASGAPNQIPINRLSPTAQVLFAILPQPTSAANPLVSQDYDVPDPNYTVTPTITFRLDHVFNQNNRAYLRYTSDITTNYALRGTTLPATLAATVNGVSMPASASGLAYTPGALFAASAGYTHIFSPTFFSETVLSQQWTEAGNFAGGAPNTDFEAELGMPNNFGEKGFPEFSGPIGGPGGTMWQYSFTQIIDDLDENLTKTLGRHQMQFGGRYGHERFGVLTNEALDIATIGADATGLENPASGANYTATTATGNSTADFFLGAAQSYVVNLEPPYVHFHDMDFDAYFQDNFHVARNFTLNLGMRYEAHPGAWMKNGVMVSFDLKNDAIVLGAPPATLIANGYTTQAIITNLENDGAKIENTQEAGEPSNMLDSYYLLFMPRLGFAWQPFGKRGTVVRGAYGRFIYPVPTAFSEGGTAGNSPFEAAYSESYITAAQAPDGLPNYLLRSAQSTAASPALGVPGIMGFNSTNAVNSNSTTGINPGIALYTMDPDLAPDQVTQANFTIEQPMPGNSALRVSWVFAHDANLVNRYLYNSHPSSYVWEMLTGTVPPTGSTPGLPTYSTTATGPYDKTTWGSSIWNEKTGWSTDNALQADYQRLFHHGIAYQISYTWSKPMHTSGESGPNGEVYNLNYARFEHARRASDW